MPTQPVLIAVEATFVGSRLVPTVSLFDIHAYVGPRQSFHTWRDRTLRLAVLVRDLDFADGGIVRGTCETSRDLRLTVPAARQLLAALGGIRAKQLNHDLVAWEQTVAAEAPEPTPAKIAVDAGVVKRLPSDDTLSDFAQIGTLCAATAVTIGGRSVLGIANARALHAGLAVGRDYTNWLKERIARFGFVQGEDYEIGVLAKSGENASGGRPGSLYTITLDMAKELAMVENSDLGRLVRRYFIWCERQQHGGNLHAQATPTSDEQAWAEWLALPISERRCRQRDIATFGRTYGVEGMRHAMTRVGLPAPPTYTADANGQFVMPLPQTARTISDPPEGSA